jgi:hypothetical protein
MFRVRLPFNLGLCNSFDRIGLLTELTVLFFLGLCGRVLLPIVVVCLEGRVDCAEVRVDDRIDLV